ncbi:surface lipoprotein assembly modifier [Pantoea sp. 18069]|uniref:surface lipoprotein assembly modifier n=1 Tax=Pantoea sp. 18069 TaxID=2681415 RepID=UPI001358A88F|nr:surface lipoprotein assembly modifier [Pantoea sp. 18069]
MTLFPQALQARLPAAFLGVFTVCSAWAQQDTADRLWQGVEQQSRRPAAPAPLAEDAQRALYDPAFAALTRTPQARAQQLLGAVLTAVNRRDWFGAERLLRQYVQVPQHDPALATFVEASRLAADGAHALAIEKYREVVQASPEFTRAELDLARVLYDDSRLRDAHAAFARLRGQPLPPEVLRHVDAYRTAIAQRERPQFSLTLAAVREDNVNSMSTVVDACALVFYGTCLQNTPGEKKPDSGIYFEAMLSKLWPLAGNHGVLLRSINYGNQYRHEKDYENLVSTNYLGYQFSSAKNQFQFLPLFEFNEEGGRKIYHAFGARLGYMRQLTQRTQLEASYEYKERRFSALFAENLQGDFKSLSLFGSYVIAPGLQAYASLAVRKSEAQQPIFFYREKSARLGIFKNFSGQVTVNAAYGWRERQAQAANAVFGRRQRDHEGSLYLNVALPGHAWQGLTPTMTYEYRDNRSSIPHAYSYEKNRLTLGFHKAF